LKLPLAPPIYLAMNYHNPIPQSGGDTPQMLKDKLTPKAIVAALDEHIVGQDDAKKAVAVALRNRWRRQQLSPELREEVTPKNILMIGPTGCGKTEISRRLARLADAPFVKVEATKFTEVGYVGRDVEQIARDLVEEAVRLERERRRNSVKAAAEEAAMEKLLDALTGKGSSEATRASFRQRFTDGSLATAEVEIDVDEAPAVPFEIPGMGAQMFDLKSIMGKAMGQTPRKRRKLKVPEAFARLTEEEADKRIDPDDINRIALADAEANGIVFLDEIDKIAVSDVRGGSVSREGVQRDLLPLIEGTTVATKYGPLKTDHMLFIASGAFHMAKPADLLPELQGRLPIRVELKALTQADFVRILSATRASLTEQYQALLATENVTITFTDDGIEALARIAAEVNEAVENIGARRLQTVMEKLLEDISFTAEDRGGETLTVDAAFVDQQLSSIARNADLSRYVL
jgi:ATP-dependent HslUV protease ATP-binding subunit HslU